MKNVLVRLAASLSLAVCLGTPPGVASAAQDSVFTAATPHTLGASDALMARVHASRCAARAASGADARRATSKLRHAPVEDDPCADSRGVGAPVAASQPAARRPADASTR